MKRKTFSRILCMLLCLILAIPTFVGCAPTSTKDSIVIMAEEFSGLFNPFYATSGSDMEVVGMTQIGMLSTDESGGLVAGDEHPTVVLDFNEGVYNEAADETVYTFVIKNGLTFSDGKPLTINDVFFNMYEYLDPVYTGSSTMYSVDIKGLSEYRTQTTDEGTDDIVAENAATDAFYRKYELISLFETEGLLEGSTSSYSMSEAEMKEAIANHYVSGSYKDAVATLEEQKTMTDNDYRAQLVADYELTLKTFREELESDYRAAKESFDLTTAPYKEHAAKLSSDIFKFFLFEGYITPKYAKLPNSSRDDKTKIESFENETILDSCTTMQAAINKVYNDNVKTALNNILSFWATSGTLLTQYTAEAIDIRLHNNMQDGQLLFPNIEGIKSLGHNTDVEKVTLGSKTYNVAHAHNEDGTPKNAGEYDVLQITVDGRDPKAIYNFSFTVAPAHYYGSANGTGNDVDIDIAANKFGVKWADSNFQSKVIQSQRNVEVPMGAGAFVATNDRNEDNPSGAEFWKSSIVYYKKNTNFMFPVKAEKLRFQVVSSSNALDKLEKGEVDYVTPQFTKANAERLDGMASKGFVKLSAWQLGYGYVGINAGKVENINIRRAIMAAMQVSLAQTFYQSGTCKPIDWPMSMESWAYPFEDDNKTSKPNSWDYTRWTGLEDARGKIRKYMAAAGVQANDSTLKFKFTIAGASITEHPTYAVFKQAAQILNEEGWNIEVKADSQALTKLATGSLEVWAAAWGSTIDPDMYQVYHKDSTATSVYAWGYREIKGNTTKYWEEFDIISRLSVIIDEARSVMTREERKPKYEDAMNLVLELAVELPVYQRMTLFAYNSNTITGLPDQSEVDSYNSPLSEIWNIELKK